MDARRRAAIAAPGACKNPGSDVDVMDVVMMFMDMSVLDEGTPQRQHAGVFIDSGRGVEQPLPHQAHGTIVLLVALAMLPFVRCAGRATNHMAGSGRRRPRSSSGTFMSGGGRALKWMVSS